MPVHSFAELFGEIRTLYDYSPTEQEFLDKSMARLVRFWRETHWATNKRLGRLEKYKNLIFSLLSTYSKINPSRDLTSYPSVESLVSHVEREFQRLIDEREHAIETQNGTRLKEKLTPLDPLVMDDYPGIPNARVLNTTTPSFVSTTWRGPSGCCDAFASLLDRVYVEMCSESDEGKEKE